MKIKKYIIISVITLVIVLGGINIYNSRSQDAVLQRWNLQDLDITELVLVMDQTTYDLTQINAGITGKELIITDEVGEFRFAVPNDLFYLSFAPYINETHPCANHNLVTCRGELPNQTFDVTITTLDGTVIVNESLTSFDNGFIGIWLEKDIEATIEVQLNGLVASSYISTFEASDTCLTTPLQLQ
jgi:hypothetical protein